LILRFRGRMQTAPIRLRRSLCSIRVRMTGVSPRGAHVRLSGETSEKPLSSRKTSVAPSCCHFFYMWPDVLFPMCNRLVIAVQRTPLQLWATPPEASHKIPDTVRAIAHPKHFPAHMRDAIQRPISVGVPVVKCAARQVAKQAPTLRCVEPTRASRAARLPLRLTLGSARLASPTANALDGDTDALSNSVWTLTAS
jgi:hypothetical protein